MAQYVYEGMFLLNPSKYAKEPAAVAEEVNKLLEAQDAEILASRLWNEQKLAYPVEGHKKGVYWLTYFRAEGEAIAKLNEACRLNGKILRTLFIRLDPRLVDVMVAHAKGEAAEGDSSDEAGDTAESEQETAAAGAES